jgi:pimeloyl-ACP methyl ester carboxylesterase
VRVEGRPPQVRIPTVSGPTLTTTTMRARERWIPAALLAALPALGVTPAGAQEPGPVGSWLGSLSVPGATLRIVFHIQEADSAYTATLDSPDQGATGIPVTEVLVLGDSVELRLPMIGGVFAGSLQGDTLAGTWSQGGMDFPLLLERTDSLPATARPQDPEPPFPYAVEEVRFPNPEAGIELAGTLTLPASPGPHPAALLVSGSGPQDRNEALMGHRPFLVLGDFLTRQGIAVLRYDDRGVGASGGDFDAATTLDLAADAAAGIAFLRTRDDIRPEDLWIVGHSEGGLVAPMVANQRGDLAGVVLLAGPGVTGDSIIRLQTDLIARAGGASAELLARQRAAQASLNRAVLEIEDRDSAAAIIDREMRTSIAAMSPEERSQAGLTDAAARDRFIAASTRRLLSPWMRFFVAYDPGPALRALDVPTLALLGSLDLQVPAGENAAALRAALDQSQAPRWDVRVLPGLNHLFQHATTGAPSEYGGIEETFAPEAMRMIADWILSVTGASERP